MIATCGRLRPDEPVTIGRPIPNYRVYILDGNGNAMPVGVAGEICLGGVGVARGYVGNPALTATKFVENPAHAADAPIVYRTGDRGRYRETGDIEFLGRIDDQIKLRGFRIELGEIEAALLRRSGVAQATVVVRDDNPGERTLVAYVVARPGETLNELSLGSELRKELAPYMIPSSIVVLAALPLLTSGKIDRRSLPKPETKHTLRPAARATNAIEARVCREWAALFHTPGEVSTDAHFFDHLGGHSLLAAQMVSSLRRDPAFGTLSVLDVYRHPTPASFAAHLARIVDAARPFVQHDVPAHGTSRHSLCSLAQLLGSYVLFAIHSLQWISPYFTYALLRARGDGLLYALIGLVLVVVASNPATLLLAIAIKWIVIGRYRPGRYRLWGLYYLRWWLVDRMLAIAPVDQLVGTPLLVLFYRALGARIGDDVFLGGTNIGAADLIEIGRDSTVGVDASLETQAVENGMLVLAPVRVGERCTLGARAVMGACSAMEDDARLEGLALLPRGALVPAGQSWDGARLGSIVSASPVERPAPATRRLFTALYACLALALPVLALPAMIPAFVAMSALERWSGGFWYLLATPLCALSFAVALCLEIAALKWLVLGRTRAGRHPVVCALQVRRWIFDRAMATSRDLLGALYATLFLNPWLRLLGVKLGDGAEVSTASDFAPDLLEIDDQAFIADCVALGAPRIERGTVTLARTRVGRRSFVGNSSLLQAGVTLDDDSLLGCMSTAPSLARRGSAWVGSPPLDLPKRQVNRSFAAESTYRPSRRLVAQRLAIELLRVTLPTTLVFAFTYMLVRSSLAIVASTSWLHLAAALPALAFGCGALAALLVAALKWALVGRHRPGERPLWSSFVWRTELVTAVHENVVDPLWNVLLLGTPLAAWFFRALGAKFGRRVYLGTTQLTEYDLVEVGDEACLNADCTLQTHLFEDRVMKMSRVRIGAQCTVGAASIVLHDTTMEQGASLGPLSLLMKGETLPAGTRWAGSPATAITRHEVQTTPIDEESRNAHAR